MKIRKLAFFLCLCFAAVGLLTACGGEPEVPVEPTETTTQAPTQAPTATKPVKPAPPEPTPENPAPTDPEPPAPTPENPAPTDPEPPTPTVPDTQLPVDPDNASGSETGRAIAKTALSLLGKPFEMGKTGPDSFDNSGFVYYCYKANGVAIPRRTSEMVNCGEGVIGCLSAGDIVLYAAEPGGEASLCAIFVGDGTCVSCNNPDSPTKTFTYSMPYWKDRVVSVRHVV